MEEFNLCTAQCDVCNRDLELIFMQRPGPHAPLFPLGPGQARVSGEGVQEEKKRSHMSEQGEMLRGREQEGAGTHHPRAAVAENRSAQSIITGSKLINKLPVLLIQYSYLDYI